MAAREIRTQIDIAAPPAAVWRVLADFDAYPEWNPFITGIAGKLQAGSRLAVRIVPTGGKTMIFRPRVIAAEAERRLLWKGRVLLPGLFDGEHEFRLEPAGTGIRFYHGEKFTGLFVSLLPAQTFVAIEAGFVAMNRALKMRSERPGRRGGSNQTHGTA